MHRKIIPAILIIAAIVTSCSAGKTMKFTKTELFFGLSVPDGTKVTAQQFQAFSDTVIAKSFSEGSTIFDAKGQWLGNNGVLVSEDTKVVIVLNKMTPETSRKIDEIREKYKKYFKQEAVLRIDAKVKGAF